MLGIGLLATFTDQLSKQIAISNLSPNLPVPVLGEMLSWRLVYNDSAAFSLGFGVTWVFTLISSVALLLLLWFSKNLASTSWAVLGGFLVGGVTGNLIDRCFRSPGFPNGHVVDFIQIPMGFPIFNLADCCISVTMAVVATRIALGHQIGKPSPKKNKANES